MPKNHKRDQKQEEIGEKMKMEKNPKKDNLNRHKMKKLKSKRKG